MMLQITILQAAWIVIIFFALLFLTLVGIAIYNAYKIACYEGEEIKTPTKTGEAESVLADVATGFLPRSCEERCYKDFDKLMTEVFN